MDQIPSFLQSIFSILTEESFLETIKWTADGTAFVIEDKELFTSKVLPLYFKHSKYNSFVRQLNLYNFSKQKGADCFGHPLFLKDKPDLLADIHRKDKLSIFLLAPSQNPKLKKLAKKIYIFSKKAKKSNSQIKNLEKSVEKLENHQESLALELWESRKKTQKLEKLLIVIVKNFKQPIRPNLLLPLE